PLPAAAMAVQHVPSTDPGDAVKPVPLADPREEYLAAIWRELIGIVDVRGSDNFFDLGGHSLLAVEFATRVQREMSVRLPLLDIATGTLASLATELPKSPASGSARRPSMLARLRGRLGWR
ncbi:MAG TPA: phosphopantetheine-binding protein, partial [Rhodanobacter sp.]